MKKIIIKVTKEDITKGVEKGTTTCPIALAVKRISPFVLRYVLGIDIWDTEGNRYSMPLKAQNFIINFDAGEKVKPFNFKLEI